MARKPKPVAAPALIKLDIACGQNKQPGHTGIDIAGDADIVHDLFTFPWPIADGSVSEAFCSHFVEHIPHYRPDWGGRDGWWMFWDEVHRILTPGGTVTVLHPYVKSDRAFWDPTHVRFIHEQTWYYLDRKWRESQGLDHYQTAADFEVSLITGVGISDDMVSRAPEVQAFGRSHYWNVVADLQVQLKRR
jgi:predicted SAM-dependent methyltransferase